MGIIRSGRFEIRTTTAIRAQIEAVAKHNRRTLTSVLDEAIEDIIKKYPVPKKQHICRYCPCHFDALPPLFQHMRDKHQDFAT
jgi:hypothetical protein